MEHKGDKDKSMMHALCCSWQKGTSQSKATLSIEEIKPVELTISSLLERFESLVMPNEYRKTVMKESEAGFEEIFLCMKAQTFMSLLYSATILYDI